MFSPPDVVSDLGGSRELPAPSNGNLLEASLHASTPDSSRNDVYDRLRRVCDPDIKDFNEHEMVFALKTSGTTTSGDVLCRFRRKLNGDEGLWHCRYFNPPIMDNAPAVCRSSINSVIQSRDLMEFVKNIGLRFDYEVVCRGTHFIKGPLKILFYKVYKTAKVGNYSREHLKPVTDSMLIEAIIPVENEDTHKYSKILKDFCDELAPLLRFQKVEYYKPRE